MISPKKSQIFLTSAVWGGGRGRGVVLHKDLSTYKLKMMTGFVFSVKENKVKASVVYQPHVGTQSRSVPCRLPLLCHWYHTSREPSTTPPESTRKKLMHLGKCFCNRSNLLYGSDIPTDRGEVEAIQDKERETKKSEDFD